MNIKARVFGSWLTALIGGFGIAIKEPVVVIIGTICIAISIAFLVCSDE